MKKILISSIIVVFLSCFSLFYKEVKAEETTNTTNTTGKSLADQMTDIKNKQEETNQKLEYVKEELSSSIIKIQELDDSIRKTAEEVEELEKNLTQMQQEVDDITSKLEEKQQEYDINQEVFDDRLVAMYEAGETSYLDILLKSANVVEFLTNYYYLQEIVDNDQKLLEEINRQKEEIEKQKKDIEQKKLDLKSLRAQVLQKSVTLQNNKTIQQNNIEQLSDNEKELQTKIQEYKDEEARIESLIKAAAGEYEYNGSFTGGIMAWPVAKSGTYITSPYAMREHPIQGVVKQHTGIDIGNAGFGAPIIAAADGIVSLAGYNGGYGNCVMINHGNGVSTLYGHGQKIVTTVGTEVKKGDLIMEVGSTGLSTGPHLHFEVRVNGTPINPMPYLTGETEKNEQTNTIE